MFAARTSVRRPAIVVMTAALAAGSVGAAAAPAAFAESLQADSTAATAAMPDWLELGEGALWAPEGSFALVTDPEVRVWACPEDAGALPSGFALELAMDSEPWTVLADGTVAAGSAPDDPACVVGSWEVPSGVLADGGTYRVRARSTLSGADPSVFGDWLAFTVALSPAVPEPVAPAEGAAVSIPRPAFVVAAPEGRARQLSMIVRVVYAGTDITAAEGTTSLVDEDGRLLWTPEADLSIGHYEWQALVTDGVSQSEWSSLVPFRVSLPPPVAPNVYSARPVRGGVTFVWSPLYTAPEDPILNYTLTASPGGRTITVAGDSTEGTIDRLPAGQYTISISGANARGSSPTTTRQVTIAPASPASPTNPQVSLDGASATLTWDAPSDSGDAPVDRYRVTSPAWAEPLAGLETQGTTVTYEDLQFATWYTAYVEAHNEFGWSEPAVVSFAPFTVPDAPTDVQVHLGDGYLDLTWAAPSSDGGAPVTEYVVTADPGGAQVTTDGVTYVRFPDLENGTEYTFTVVAVNDAGPGPSSAPTGPRAPTSQTTDTDADGLPDILEERTGANPLLPDTDFDGLSDADEFNYLSGLTSPVSADSDEDGIGDAQADSDADGVTNESEIAAGTQPADPDTDGDSLDDGHELGTGTDPLTVDTDGDGVDDALEADIGFDPLLPDSDGDGTLDTWTPAEVDVTADGAVAAVSGPAASLSGIGLAFSDSMVVEGAVSGVASVEAPTAVPDEAQPAPASLLALRIGGPGAQARTAALSPPVALTSPVSLTLPVAAWQPVDAPEYGAFEWDSETMVWRPSAATVTVSAAEHTVTIHSPELNVSYTVVDLQEWRARARECDLAAGGDARLSVEVILDETNSVRGLDPSGERFEAVSAVLSTLEAGDEATLRAVGTMTTNYGWGESYELREYEDPTSDTAGNSVARVRERLEMLSTLAAGNPEWYDPDHLVPGAAEAIFDGATSWMDRPPRFNPFTGEEYETIPQWCRMDVVVVVTDGQLVPPETGPLGEPPVFRQRTSPPVYVLDVGPGGEDAQWLRDVAQQTGGAYTHVPTATTVPVWNRDAGFDGIDPAQYMQDPDGDGVLTWVEVQGVRAASGNNRAPATGRKVFYSDPNDPDTDGDGILDGVEFGIPITPQEVGGWTSDWPVSTYWMTSDPGLVDGDHDGLPDSEEVDLGLNALHPDADGDGLDDRGEGEWGTDPFKPDYDSDGYSDGYEALHFDEGYSPWEYNEREDPMAFFADFAAGFFCGDTEYCRRSSIAWLLGNISSGIAVFGDVRDLVWSIRDGEPINATMISVGLIPGIGDAAGAAAKITRHLDDLVGPAADAGRHLLRQSTEAVDFISNMRQLHPDVVQALERAGTSVETMARLLEANKPEYLKRLLDAATAWPASAYTHGTPTFMPSGTDGERFMRNFLGLDPFKHESGLYLGAVRPANCKGCRYPDGLVRLPNGDIALHEAKVGWVRGWFSNGQITKDIALIEAGRAPGGISWHFFASYETGRIGPSETILKRLQDAGITIYIHLPS